jgi:hypothetical protein
MRPLKRAKVLNADEHRVLKKTAHSRKLAAGKVRRTRIVLHSNQGHTARETASELGSPSSPPCGWRTSGTSPKARSCSSGAPRPAKADDDYYKGPHGDHAETRPLTHLR